MTEVRRERLNQGNSSKRVDKMLFNPVYILKVELKRFTDRLCMDGRTRRVEMTLMPLTLVSGRIVLPFSEMDRKDGAAGWWG